MTPALSLLTSSEWHTLNNQQLAARFDLHPNYVSNYRRVNGKPKGPRCPGSGRKRRFDLTRIDWSRGNAENAAVVGCTVAYINMLRRQKAVREEDFA